MSLQATEALSLCYLFDVSSLCIPRIIRVTQPNDRLDPDRFLTDWRHALFRRVAFNDMGSPKVLFLDEPPAASIFPRSARCGICCAIWRRRSTHLKTGWRSWPIYVSSSIIDATSDARVAR